VTRANARCSWLFFLCCYKGRMNIGADCASAVSNSWDIMHVETKPESRRGFWIQRRTAKSRLIAMETRASLWW